jgi:hypothetical protein
MTRKGRKPMGPALVERLGGSFQAKQRMEAILETIAGRLPIPEACRRLGIHEAMFYRLRTEVLEAGIARLEPRPMGRPPHQATAVETHCEQLQHHVAELESELKIAAVREEIARVMPHVAAEDPSLKKTTGPPPRGRRRRPQRRSRRRPKF